MSHKNRKIITFIRIWFFPVLLAGAIWIFLVSVGSLESNQKIEGQKQLEESIHKAVMTCYACEGIYPPDLDYLKENYGIQIDDEAYVVFYEVFADNIMPSVSVITKQ